MDLNFNSTRLDPAQEQLIRQVVASILKPAEKGECRCHWLDAQKVPILAWKGKTPNSLVLKIATQKLFGFTRLDKNGGEYWKFHNAQEISKTASTPTTPAAEPEAKPAEKVNLPTAEENQVQLESEAVKKFREKYGNPNSETQ